jgi:hypothetical protein
MPVPSVRDLPKHRVMKVKITKLENIVLMLPVILGGPRILHIGLAHPKLLLPYTEWATMCDEGKKLPN